MPARQIIIRPGPYALALSLSGMRRYLFDGMGRLVFAHTTEMALRRGLGNRLVEERHCIGSGDGSPVRRDLGSAEKLAFFNELRKELESVRAAAAGGSASIEGGPEQAAAALGWLDRTLGWDYAALESDASEFRRIYPSPVNWLPPDRWLSVVLQITDGPPKRCAQCHCRENATRAKGLSEFRSHAEAVNRLIGPDALRRGVFLGDLNVLTLPLPHLREYMSVARDLFPLALREPGEGFSAYADQFAREHKTRAFWTELAYLGMSRVYLAPESGNPGLLRALGSSGGPLEVLEVVTALRSAGISIRVIVTTGVGGRRHHAAHVQDTVALIRCLDLGLRDMLYIKDFTETDGAFCQYPALVAESDSATDGMVAEQVAAFARAAQRPGSSAARVATFSSSERPL